MQLLTYLFWPNPGTGSYGSPKSIAILALCAVLIAGYFIIKMWRARQSSALKKKLSATWPAASMTFGVIGLILSVARIEGIQYIGMRAWWIVWALAAVAYVILQFRGYRRRYYEVLPAARISEDPYIPKKKKR
jgi:hypothetical protein